ncbi:MAG: DNA repair protein RecN, partial [Caulobacteraceae bacterium]
TAAAAELAAAVAGELGPLRLAGARFEPALVPLAEGRAGAAGMEGVEFRVATLPGAALGSLGAIASAGELSRFALALKVSLGRRGAGRQPLMVFDEVDEGVGGAVADAVGQRLFRLARQGQVLAVTHSPQIAARADAHWKVERAPGAALAAVRRLGPAEREEEIARMLSGARITEAARAAARALMAA